MPFFGPPNIEKLLAKRNVPKLIKALGYKEFSVRKSAAQALGEIGEAGAVEPLCAALKDEDPEVAVAARGALIKIGVPAVKPLMGVLKEDAKGARNLATQALGKIGAPAVEVLRTALQSEDKATRRTAADALGKMRIPAVVEPLLAALKDEDRDVRKTTVEALGDIGDSRAVELLCSALKDGDSDVRFRAANALGKFSDARTVDPLMAALKDEDKVVRRRAAVALGKIGEPAVEPLLNALKENDKRLQEQAEYALGEIGMPAMESLLSTLRDDNFVVRSRAAEALVKIGAPALGPLMTAIHDHDRVRQMATRSLKKICDNYEDGVTLLNIRRKFSRSLRQEVARALFYQQQPSRKACPKCRKVTLIVAEGGDLDNKGRLKLSCLNCFHKVEFVLKRHEFDILGQDLRRAGFKPTIVDEFDLIHLKHPDSAALHMDEIRSLANAVSDDQAPGDTGLRMLEARLIAVLTVILTDATGVMPDLQYLLDSQEIEG